MGLIGHTSASGSCLSGWQPQPQHCGGDSGAHLANLTHRLGLDDAAEKLEAEITQLEGGQVADH